MNANFAERMSETRATTVCETTLRTLQDLTNEPSTKRFLKSRATRMGRWMELEAAARAQINGLQALAKAPRAVKSSKARTSSVPINSAHIDSETSRLVTSETQQTA